MVSRASSRCARSGWRQWLVTTVLSVTAAHFAAAGPDAISLPEEVLPELRPILQQAVRQSPTMQLESLQQARIDAEYLVARAVLLPQLTFGGNYSISRSERRDVPSSVTDDDGFFYSVGVSQSVFHWGALKAQRDIADLERLVSENNLDDARRRLVQSVRSQYLGLVMKQQSLRNQRFGKKLHDQTVAWAEERFSQGLISPAEIEQVRLGAQEAQYLIDLYEHDFASSIQIFGRLIGNRNFDGATVPAQLPRPAYDEAEVERTFQLLSVDSLREVPAVQSRELRLVQEEKRYDIARAMLRPKVSLSASYGLTNLTSATAAGIDQTGVVTAAAGIGVNWAIFDGFAARGRKRASLMAQRVGERELDLFLENTLQDLRRMQREIELTAQQLRYTERRYELTLEGVERARTELEAGRLAQSQFDSTLRQAQDSELALLRLRAELMNRWVEYLSLSGQDPMVRESLR